ncbi:MAG: hypothetical protein IT342_19520 [Candidatus Melainabacteria bacterium]|nr:hypothetical protein [Candidatus Melainabacteria bacterium]
MKQFFKQALTFLSIIIIPLMGIEISLQGLRPYQWFNGYANLYRNMKVDYIFMGNSMINAAVREKEFAAQLSEKGKPVKQAMNLGQGYTTPVEYLFGLQRMVAVNPHVIEGAIIFFPATGGLPDIRTWNDNWMDWHQPALLADYISYPDLLKYCMKSNVSLSEKVLLVASKHSELVAQGGLLRVGTMYSLDEAAEWLTHGGKITKKGVLVVQEGGIRADEDAVANFKAQAHRQAAADLKNQKPVDWDATVLKDIFTYVKAHGGKMCFIYVPVGDVMRKPLSTEIRQQDIRNFEKVAKEWGCTYYKPDFQPAGEDDFPDLLHLSEPKSHLYTKALAEEYMRNPP